MHQDVWLVYFHLVCIIGTASLLVAEMLICKPGIGPKTVQRLRSIDGAYGAFAVAALISGGLLVFGSMKGRGYYFANPVFHAKFGLFVLIALLSILPTVRFIQWAKVAQRDTSFAPPPAALGRVRLLLHVQATLLLLLPLLGAAIARGVTSFGQLFG